MTARAYQITLISRTARTVRHIIAHSTVEALRTGILMMEKLDSPCGITCKPVAHLSEESFPCLS